MERLKIQKIRDKEFEDKLGAMYKQGLLKEDVKNRLQVLAELQASINQWQKDRKFSDLLDLFKALANENRLLILLLVNQGVKCSCELEKLLGLSQSTVSHHIKVLADVGALSVEKTGKWSLVSTEAKGLTKDFFVQLLNRILN
ncbi:MAG: ArsR/SmtB family transcription factor [Candidatus Hermodarchaeota archaeon]